MGVYVNQIDMTKEEWLESFGEKLAGPPISISERPGSLLPVCLVDNGLFTAAGVAYSEVELEVFAYRPGDTRPKTWFWAPKEKLLEASNLLHYLEASDGEG